MNNPLKISIEGDPNAAAILLGALEVISLDMLVREMPPPDETTRTAARRWYVTADMPAASPVVSIAGSQD